MQKGTKISLIVLSVVIILGILGTVIYFGLIPQSIVQIGDYECPQDFKCSVTPILVCNQEQTDQRVILRTNSPNFNPTSFGSGGVWISLDTNGDGALEGYVKTTKQSQCIKDSQAVQNFFENRGIGVDFIYKYNDKVFVCTSSTKSYEFEKTQLSEDSIFPVEPYKSNQQEKYEGDLYACSRVIKIDGESKETISHYSDSPTSSSGKRGNTYSLTEGQKITSEGTGIFKVEYDSEYYEEPITTCTAENNEVLNIGESTCLDQWTAEKCLDPPQTQKEYAQEGQVCRDGKIEKAFEVDIDFERQVISTGEKFEIDFNLYDTPDNKNIDVTASIMKGQQTMVSKTQKTGNTPFNAGKTHFSLDSPPIGYYTLKITFAEPDGGSTYEYDVQVTDSLSLVLRSNNPVQFDNKDVEVILESYKGGGFKSLSNYEMDAMFNGIKKYPSIVETGGVGILKFNFDLSGDGILRVRARGSDETGLWTQWTNYYEVNVKEATILFDTDFLSNKCTGTYTNSFSTKDSSGSLVDTNNIVKIERPLGGQIDTPSLTGSGGNYQFTYNFDQQGLYVVKITSSDELLGTSQLNGGSGQTITILGGGNCGGGGDVTGGINWTMWVIIGGLVLAIGVFIFIIFFRRKK